MSAAGIYVNSIVSGGLAEARGIVRAEVRSDGGDMSAASQYYDKTIALLACLRAAEIASGGLAGARGIVRRSFEVTEAK